MLSARKINFSLHVYARTTAEVDDPRIGKRLVVRCPVGGSEEKAAERGSGRHLVALAVVQTFYFSVPMKTQPYSTSKSDY